VASPVGVWRLTEGQTPRFSAMKKEVGNGPLQSALGVLRRKKRRDFLAMMKGVGGGFSSWRLASYGGTNAAIFGITTKFTVLHLQYVYSTNITTTTTVQGGEGRR